jgi:hypothetical protein
MSGWRTITLRFRGFILFGLLLLLIALQASLNAQEGQVTVSKSLSDSLRRVVFDRGAFFSNSAAMPSWNNGYLASREVETFQAGTSNVRLYDQSGQLVREAGIWFPGSLRVLILSATATPDGRIIAAGEAQKRDGSSAPFIALTDLAGKVTNIIQTTGFVPANMCQAPDGTVWSFGGVGFDDRSHPKQGDTLRHFDFQKGQIGSYLPRSTFPDRLHPAPDVAASIRCSASGVKAYSRSAKAYIEMDYGDTKPRVYHAEAPANLRLAGFTTVGTNEVYAYFYHAGSGGLYYLATDASTQTAEWFPVKGTIGTHTEPGVVTGLWGSDGDKLLVSRAGDNAGDTAVHWAIPRSQ